MFFELPHPVNLANIHPDLLGLACLILAYPFSAKTVQLDFAVSKSFVSLSRELLHIETVCPSAEISQRNSRNGRPALAYSGGVDSTAALQLLPEERIVYFIDRVQTYSQPTLYSKEAAVAAVSDLRRTEKSVLSIPTEMEYLRKKIGFPVDLLNVDVPHPVSIPALLMADEKGIDSVAYGVVFESAYNVGHEKFISYPRSKHYKKWAPLFDLVGCELFLPTAGISEVGTTKIVNEIECSNFVRSCMRGAGASSCGKCIKCLRKGLLDRVFNGGKLDAGTLESNLDSDPVLKEILSTIRQHENVYRYIAQKMQGNQFADKLNERLKVDGEDSSWMERWYPGSIDLIPSKYRDCFLRRLFKFLPPMSDTDIDFVESWDWDRQKNSNASALLEWQSYLKGVVPGRVDRILSGGCDS